MKFNSLTLNNFKCFTKTTVELPDSNGLYLVTGKNLQVPALGSNGLGKSSLFDALCFVLYGKTAKGSKAGKLMNRNPDKKLGSGYSVEISLEKDGTTHTIRRSWSPNSLTLGKDEVVQEAIDEFIGLTFEQFLYAVYFQQQGTHFIDLTAGDKLNFLSELFQLDKWVKCGDVAKTKASAITYDLVAAETEKNSLVSRLDTLLKNIDELEKKSAVWQENQDIEVLKLKSELDSMLAAIADLVPEELNSDLLLCIKEVESEIATYQANIKDHNTYRDKLLAEHAVLKNDIKRIEREIVSLKNQNDTCPTCKQKITVADNNQLIMDLEKKSAELVANDLYPSKIEKLEEGIKGVQDMIVRQTEQRQRYLEDKKTTDLKNQVIEEKKKAVRVLELRIETQLKQNNPYQEQINGAQTTVLNESAKLDGFVEKLDFLHKQHDNYTFWQKLFPQIRLEILNEVVEELELHFNQAFAQIGLFDWSIVINTVKELKNETLKNELTVKLLQKGIEVDLDSLSGGERQRIRLCTALGISELIKGRLGVPLNLLLFDEPMASLSAEGIELMLDLFTSLADNNTVLLAEHRILELTKFNGTFEITKNNNGNSTICSPTQSFSLNPSLALSTDIG